MYFDPPEQFKPGPKPPELSPAEISAEESRFVEEVRRELIIRGDESKTISALVAEMRSRLTVTPRLGPSHKTRYLSHHGGMLDAKQAAEAIVEAATEQDAMAAFGPDPLVLLRARLVSLGIPESEAWQRAAGRIKRLEDGRVAAYKANGTVLHMGLEPVPGRAYTDAEKALFTDAGPALQRVTRAIVEERERGGASDPLNRPVQSSDPLEEKRAFIAGAF